MNKKEFTRELAMRTELTIAQSEKCITAFMKIIEEQLKKDEKVQFLGWGTFKRCKRTERTGKNPRTGERVIIPEKNVVKFKPGKNLKDAVNEAIIK
ncbi:MAG: HU family DNA-binding protein [Hespellia sp.]|nr:HU family DNA-binding protein [Hespellia sp.]